MLFMLDPGASVMLFLLMGLIVLLPLSSDPLRAIPRVRMQIWPLDKRDRRILRFASLWLSPMTWIIVALALWRRASIGIAVLAAGVTAAVFLIPAPSAKGGSPWRRLPSFPRPFNQLIRKNIRETLSTLDFFCGALISITAILWRIAGTLPADALFPLTAIAMLAISTCALSQFGLDGAAGLTRYRLMPVRGWHLLIAKDAAFLLVASLLTAPLSFSGGLAAALVALAIGHRTSVRTPRPQTRWRFQTGPSLGDAMAQIIPMTMAGAGAVYSSPLILLPCAAAWAGSTWWFGREIDRRW
jgi:hypothetical protein